MLNYNQFDLPIESTLLEFIKAQSEQYNIPITEAFKLVASAVSDIPNTGDEQARINEVKAKIIDLAVKSKFKNELDKLAKWGIGFHDGAFLLPTLARFAQTTKSTQNWGIQRKVNTAPNITGIPVEVKGEVGAALKIHVADASTNHKAFEVDMPELDYGINLNVELAANASINASGQAGIVSGNFATGGHFEFDVYCLYQYDGTKPALEAFSDTFTDVASHKFVYFDLHSISKSLAPPQSGNLNDFSGLRRVEVNYKNSVSLSGMLSLGESISEAEIINVNGKAHHVSANISLGLSASYQSKLNGNFRTYCQKLSPNSLVITLESLDEGEQVFNFALGADMKVEGLDELGKTLIDGYLPYEQQWKDDLAQWSNIGDLLQTSLTSKLQSMVETDAVWQQLVKTALGEDKSAEIVTDIQKQIDDELSSQSGKLFNWLNDGTAQINNAISEQVAKLGLPTQVTTYLNEILAQTAVTAVNNANQLIQSKVNDKIERLSHQANANVRKWLEPLTSLGEQVNEVAADINAYSEKVLEATIALLGEYQQFRQRLLEGAKKAAEFQVAMQLGCSAANWSKDKALLALIIDPKSSDERVAEIYKLMMLGKAGEALNLARMLEAETCPALKSIKGEFATWSKQIKELKLGIQLGKVNLFDASTRKLSEINIKVDASGNLLVGDVDAKLDKEAGYFAESRKLSVFSTSNIMKASAQNRLPSIGGVSLSLDDKHLKMDELEEFLYSLEARGLLHSGLTSRTLQLYRRKKSYHSAAVLSASMILPSNFYKKLAQLSDEQAYELACNSFFETGFSDKNLEKDFWVLCNGFEPTSERNMFIKMVGKKKRKSQACEYINSNFNGGQTVIPHSHYNFSPKGLAPAAIRMLSVHKCAQAFAEKSELLNELGEISMAFKKSKPTDLAPWREKLNEVVDELNDSVDEMVSVKGVIAGLFDESVNWNTLAFLCLLSDLNEPTHTKLTVTLTIKNSETEESFVLS
ncbi:hypothetical protein L1286_14870 [Pseudoalteromonas sp. SMS1]|uniref:hypothetical protein n=1 Tax=Pseudoalteromonas sp. SMS1 TaxID=2908894 RepID=UPI001F476782|nr:hypothetical protein [Pseudoalteromonas sp. SMS1]MCF2858766.1 hypothetical protein [Pseudoalteromonas sp. SMS1]